MKCHNCGGSELTWHCENTTNSGVVDGRLRLSDVSVVFYLGCDNCSETIKEASGTDVAAMLNEAKLWK